MASNGFFKDRRVYLLTAVAYMGSLLFGYVILGVIDLSPSMID